MKSILYLCKSLVDAELIYNLSSLANCYNFHLLRYYWSNMALIHVSHPHCSIISVAFWFYIFWRVLPKKRISITYFGIHSYCTIKLPGGLVISYHCASLVLIYEVYASVYLQQHHWFWQIMIMIHLGIILHEGGFLSSRVIRWLFFKNILP